MTCAACSARVERGLKQTAGVSEAGVNLATEKAVITYDSSQINVRDLIQRIQELGYGVLKEKVTFTISGMICAACSARIGTKLAEMEGVLDAYVNLATIIQVVAGSQLYVGAYHSLKSGAANMDVLIAMGTSAT